MIVQYEIEEREIKLGGVSRVTDKYIDPTSWFSMQGHLDNIIEQVLIKKVPWKSVKPTAVKIDVTAPLNLEMKLMPVESSYLDIPTLKKPYKLKWIMIAKTSGQLRRGVRILKIPQKRKCDSTIGDLDGFRPPKCSTPMPNEEEEEIRVVSVTDALGSWLYGDSKQKPPSILDKQNGASSKDVAKQLATPSDHQAQKPNVEKSLIESVINSQMKYLRMIKYLNQQQ